MKKRKTPMTTPKFHARHGKHGVTQIRIAGGAKTLHKCVDCGRAHVEEHR